MTVMITTRSCDNTFVNMQRQQPHKVNKLLILNACSIRNKFVQINDCITSNGFDFFVVVETWHESETCPFFISCMQNGYRCIELSRAQSSEAVTSRVVNHGGVCLIYRSPWISLSHHKEVEMPSTSREQVSILSSSSYSPGSQPANSTFLTNFPPSSSASMSEPVVIVGDNIHLNDFTLLTSVNFNNINSGCDLKQQVAGYTHEAGHTLDVVITINTFDIKITKDSPVLSDHLLTSAELFIHDVSQPEVNIVQAETKCNWKMLACDAFRRAWPLVIRYCHQAEQRL